MFVFVQSSALDTAYLSLSFWYVSNRKSLSDRVFYSEQTFNNAAENNKTLLSY